MQKRISVQQRRKRHGCKGQGPSDLSAFDEKMAVIIKHLSLSAIIKTEGESDIIQEQLQPW